MRHFSVSTIDSAVNRQQAHYFWRTGLQVGRIMHLLALLLVAGVARVQKA